MRGAGGHTKEQATAEADEIIAKFDTDGDGQLDVEEYCAWCAANPKVCAKYGRKPEASS